MRIGLIRFKYDSSGGAERTLYMLAQALLNRGHEVHVVTTRWEGPRPEGLKVHYVFIDRTPSWAQAADWAVAAMVNMASWGVDVFMSLERVPGAPVVRAGEGCHAAWLERRAPYCGWVKRLSFRLTPRHRTWLDLERRTFTHPALKRVIAPSRMVAQELSQHYALAPEKIRVIYNPVDPARITLGPQRSRVQIREALGVQAHEKILLMLGSGFERKGLGFAIAALAHMPPEVVLLVAGRDRPGPYMRLARSLGVEGRVRMLGQREDVARLLHAADAMVLPTIYDPCANATLEAMAAGVAVVTTTANGASELLSAHSGVVVEDPSNVEQLAEACLKALELNPSPAQNLPTMEQWVEQVVEVLAEARE